MRVVLAICAIVCCTVCMHVVVQCFALVRGVNIVAVFVVELCWGCARRFCDMCWMAFRMFVFVLCAFFCPEHVCGCSFYCVCARVALVRPQRLCSEESNAYTNIAIYWCGHLCSAKGFSGSVHRNMWQHGFCVKLQMIFQMFDAAVVCREVGCVFLCWRVGRGAVRTSLGPTR